MGEGNGSSMSCCLRKALISSKKSAGGGGNSALGSMASAGSFSTPDEDDMSLVDDASEVQEAVSLSE